MDIDRQSGDDPSGIQYSEAVEVLVAPSRALALLMGLACAATLAVVAMTPMSPALRIAIAATTLLAFTRAVGTVALGRGRRVAGFRVALDRAIRVREAGGREAAGKVVEGSFVAPWLTIVRWRPERARFDRTLLLVPGMIDAESYRRLRVLLRWQ